MVARECLLPYGNAYCVAYTIASLEVPSIAQSGMPSVHGSEHPSVLTDEPTNVSVMSEFLFLV